MILMPIFSKRLRAKRGDLGILDGQDLRQHFDDGHLGAHGPVEVGELDADGARAHDQQRLREGLRDHGLVIGPDQLAVGLQARQGARAGARRDDDVLGRVGARRPCAPLGGGTGGRPQRRLRRGLHLDRADLGDLRLAPDDVDLVLLEQEADAARELRRHAARAFHRRPWQMSKPDRPLARRARTRRRAACCGRPRPSAASAFVGMQPQFRQMPPRCSRSTTAVLKPSCAARIAVT